MKLGIMGGTFNPIHNAHLAAAMFALEEFSLDRVIFLTSGSPPHKTDMELPPASVRHELVKAAVKGNPLFLADDYEVRKKSYSYTSETLCHYRRKYPDDELYFIIGTDSLKDLPGWHEPEMILSLSSLIVYPRSGSEDTQTLIDETKQTLGGNILRLHAPFLDISSTYIRGLIKGGRSARYLTPSSVLSLIESRGLYRK